SVGAARNPPPAARAAAGAARRQTARIARRRTLSQRSGGPNGAVLRRERVSCDGGHRMSGRPVFVVAGPGSQLVVDALDQAQDAWPSLVPVRSVAELAERFPEARFVATADDEPPLPAQRWTRVGERALLADPRGE